MNRKFASLALIVALILSTPVKAEFSEASTLSYFGTMSVVTGSIMIPAGSVYFVIESVKFVGSKATIVLRHASQGTKVVLQGSVRGAGQGSLVAGQSIEVTSQQIGLMLTHAGKLLAYIPNELGASLLHQSEH